jgi:hypothetical protein
MAMSAEGGTGWLEAVSAAALAEFAVRASGRGPAGAAAGDGGAQYVAVAGGRLVPAPDLDAGLVRSLIEASTKAIASPFAAIEVGAREGASGIELVIRSIGSEAPHRPVRACQPGHVGPPVA